MDLRRSVLKKQQILTENSFSLNNSAYESAADETDNSIYYSFSNDSSSKSLDLTGIENISNVSDKENENLTVIQRQSLGIGLKTPVFGEHQETEQICDIEEPELIDVDYFENEVSPIELKQPEVEQMDVSVSPEAVSVPPAIAEAAKEFPQSFNVEERLSEVQATSSQVSNSTSEVSKETQEQTQADLQESSPQSQPSVQIDKENKPETTEQAAGTIANHHSLEARPEALGPELASVMSPLILVHDPNENVINPFTYTESNPQPPPTIEELRPIPTLDAAKKSARRSVLTTKIPGATHFYSPVLRGSIDKKSRLPNKPLAGRRTIYERPKPSTSTMMVQKGGTKPSKAPTKGPQKAKTPTQIPVPKPMVKPRNYKCSIAACLNEEFPTLKAYQDHQKTHRNTTKIASTSSSFICQYCDKTFQLQTALLNHQSDNCVKIPPNEKRKILGQRDKKEINRRRTSMFTAPVPKRKSPMRRPIGESLNKSGIKITPKKSLKCHLCDTIVTDVASLANHILSHKFER